MDFKKYTAFTDNRPVTTSSGTTIINKQTMNQNNIKPQELRIGNWAQYKFYNPHPEKPSYEYTRVKIRGIYEDSIRFSFPNHNSIHKAKEVFPIPLSEEVLLKAGFIKDGFQDIYVSFTKGNIKLWHDVKKNVFTVDGLKFINVNVTSLHQLQNLFYLLTGEELEMSMFKQS